MNLLVGHWLVQVSGDIMVVLYASKQRHHRQYISGISHLVHLHVYHCGQGGPHAA